MVAAPKIKIVYYSTYGHIRKMAVAIQESLTEAGADVEILQVPETLSEEVLKKMGAPPKPDDRVATTEDLVEADGILFGMPTRFGMMAAQMKAFFDSTGGLWQKGALVGKPAGLFFSTASQGGGQETTGFTALTQLTHHGMVYVPMGYIDPAMFGNDEVRGGSAYGPGTLANGDGSRQPSERELGIARSYGGHFAKIVAALKRGKEAAE